MENSEKLINICYNLMPEEQFKTNNPEAVARMMTEAQNTHDLLTGIRILVTRPAHQADTMCTLLAQHGGEPVCLPVIDIVVTALKENVIALLNAIESISFAIFISPNAVEHGLAALLAHGKIPDTLKLVTIGQASADKMFHLLARMPDIYPREQYNSEALLALEALSEEQIKGRSVLIFRGEGGRELLGNTLLERGAKLTYAEVYRRQLPAIDQNLLTGLFISGKDCRLGKESRLGKNSKAQTLDIISLTSNEGLQNLQAMLTKLPQELSLLALQGMWQLPLLVVTEKMRDNARQMGFTNTIVVVSKASNEAMLESVLEWAKLNNKNSSA